MMFSALDGHLARVMFGKLARAVLAIEPGRRTALLRRTVLPGLLDGRADGAVLRDFPDPDLAESLCLLMELEAAAPEVVGAALHRLDLPAERRQIVASLVDERLRSGTAVAAIRRDESADRFARRLVQVEAAPGKSFAEFAAFDLSIDDQHRRRRLPRTRQTVGPPRHDARSARLPVAARRVGAESGLVNAFMQRALDLFWENWTATARWPTWPPRRNAAVS